MEEINNKLDKVSEKLDKMSDILTTVQISQAKTEVNMAEHIRRTGLAEENIALLRKETKDNNASFNQQLEPIKEHVTQVRTAVKYTLYVFGALSALITWAIAHFKK